MTVCGENVNRCSQRFLNFFPPLSLKNVPSPITNLTFNRPLSRSSISPLANQLIPAQLYAQLSHIHTTSISIERVPVALLRERTAHQHTALRVHTVHTHHTPHTPIHRHIHTTQQTSCSPTHFPGRYLLLLLATCCELLLLLSITLSDFRQFVCPVRSLHRPVHAASVPCHLPHCRQCMNKGLRKVSIPSARPPPLSLPRASF